PPFLSIHSPYPRKIWWNSDGTIHISEVSLMNFYEKSLIDKIISLKNLRSPFFIVQSLMGL
ncbi:MAG: hypothetical protein IJR80_01465, partial [Treponema sp.]|nr:hypothetical protein [Treponema sp.]